MLRTRSAEDLSDQASQAASAEIVGGQAEDLGSTNGAAQIDTETVESAASMEVPQDEPAEDKRLEQHEVDAVLASLGPAIGFDAVSHEAPVDEIALAPWAALQNVTVSREATLNVAGGRPRWIAEAVPLSAEETSCMLEAEMQNACAALAAEAARATEPVLAAASGDTAEIEAGIPPMGAEDAAPEPAIPAMEQDTAPVDAYAYHEQAPVSKALPEPINTTVQAAAAEGHVPEVKVRAVAAGAEDVAQEIVGPEVSHEAAAGSMAGHGMVQEQEVHPPVLDESAVQRESELAEAWAHWKEIRAAVVSPQFTSQLADSAANFREIQQKNEEPSSPSPDTPAGSPPAAASNTIASIVDSVLSELRPKLVEEISKRLAAEKKS